MNIPNLSKEGKAVAMQAAIELCKLRGLDPTARVQVPDPNGYAVCRYGTQAEALMPEIIAHAQCAMALRTVYERSL